MQMTESQAAERPVEDSAQQQVRAYFQEVSERCKLPALPAAVATGLKMVRDPDLDFQKFGRVLSSDAALVGRILRTANSAFYGRRSSAQTIEQAIPVLGLRTVQRVLVTAATQQLCLKNSGLTQSLWDHSLVTAISAELIAKKVGGQDLHLAFLCGLLHDIGQMVLLHGDPEGFTEVVNQVREMGKPILACEKENYGFDHGLIGVVLVDCWELDPKIGQASSQHHTETAETAETGETPEVSDPLSTGMLIQLADYVAAQAGHGFMSVPLPPPATALAAWGYAEEDVLSDLITQVQETFEAEKALYTS
jgi:putative nucleotidyltransferase with HDIG domain